jgi:hypothetical protein
MLYHYVDQNGKQHTVALHVGGEHGWPTVIIDGVPEQWTDVTPPELAASDAVLLRGEDYVLRQINCDGERVFVDGRWRADGMTEIPSSGGTLIVHCGLPGAPRYGPPDVYLSERSTHPSGGIAPATERAITANQVGPEASAPGLWYMLHPGGLAGLSHWAACGGVFFVALDTAPSLAGKKWQDWTAEGPFNDKRTCENLIGSDRRGGAICVPEDDPRVDPEIRAIAHFPTDAATGRILFSPEFQKRYPTRLLTPAEADQPCPKGSVAPWGLVQLKAEMEQARAAAAKSMDQPPAASQ